MMDAIALSKNLVTSVPEVFTPLCLEGQLTSLVVQAGVYLKDTPKCFLQIAGYFRMMCRHISAGQLHDSNFQDLSLMIQAYLETAFESQGSFKETAAESCHYYLLGFTDLANAEAKVDFVCSHLNLEYYIWALRKLNEVHQKSEEQQTLTDTLTNLLDSLAYHDNLTFLVAADKFGLAPTLVTPTGLIVLRNLIAVDNAAPEVIAHKIGVVKLILLESLGDICSFVYDSKSEVVSASLEVLWALTYLTIERVQKPELA